MITAQKAKEIMDVGGSVVIVDVRRRMSMTPGRFFCLIMSLPAVRRRSCPIKTRPFWCIAEAAAEAKARRISRPPWAIPTCGISAA